MAPQANAVAIWDRVNRRTKAYVPDSRISSFSAIANAKYSIELTVGISFVIGKSKIIVGKTLTRKAIWVVFPHARSGSQNGSSPLDNQWRKKIWT